MMKRESSSAGRARPCQGRGRGFESRLSLQEIGACAYSLFGCEPNGRPGGGIGRHVGLKIQWALARAGSSPAPGTDEKRPSF